MGLEDCIYFGNIDAKRDWGHAKDYVEMQWMMLQNKNPEDFVIATGRMETVRRFCELSAIALGWFPKNCKTPNGIIWEGNDINEIGRREDTKAIVIRIDKRYYRPTEVQELLGDSSKAKAVLGWEPKITLEEMIKEMILNDKEIAQRELNFN